ncbi:hypothetical protein [Yinghuangia seranimata]|uniref:hypothetical protein n=1 Tax=Yinghuangia seranimata TaxID=408067 RepID=UPI00248C0C97|nr:hypothetical protein [Yinghuangia seranimata]MDI2128142.1 hypothetical protein [Yinghuangia seranimata]
MRRLQESAEQARPVWEQQPEHDAFRRFLKAQGWSAITSIYVIRSVQGCDLKDAVQIYDSYWHEEQGRGG